jgi:hypothetical protein
MAIHLMGSLITCSGVCASEEEAKKKKLSACRGEGSAAGPPLAAHAPLLRCAARAVLSSAQGTNQLSD